MATTDFKAMSDRACRTDFDNNLTTILNYDQYKRIWDAAVSFAAAQLTASAQVVEGDAAVPPRPIGTHKCPRREESHFGHTQEELPDYWRAGNTCSYCGSLDPDVFMRRVEEGSIMIKGSDKNYKVYVEAASGSEPLGAIKFYWMHLSEDQQDRFVQLWNEKRVKHSIYVWPYFMAPRPGQTPSAG